jgi:hypothetical protein
MHFVVTALVFAALGAGAASAFPGVLPRILRRLGVARDQGDDRPAVTRLDAHMSAAQYPRFTPAKSAALRRDVQEKFETKEATHDLEVLDRSLRDIRMFSLHFRESQLMRMLAEADLGEPFHSKQKYGPKLERQSWEKLAAAAAASDDD